MKILFVGGNGAGTLFPLIPLAQAARNAGHETVVTGPESVVHLIFGAGLPGLAVTDKALTDCRVAGWGNTAPISEDGIDRLLSIGRMFGRFASSCLDRLLALTDTWHPDLVVAGVLAYAAPLVAHYADVPFARFTTNLDEPVLANLAAATELGPELERLGLYDMPKPDLAIDVCPPSVRPPHVAPALPMRHVPYTSQRPLGSWLHARSERPRVLVSVGSRATVERDFAVLDGLLRKIEGLDLELLIAAPEPMAAELTNLPARSRAGWMPLDVVTPTCDLLVHHGGGSTTLHGMASAVPQIILPRTPVLDFTERLDEHGCATLIRPEDDTAERVASAIDEMLHEPSYRIAAQHLRDEIRTMPHPTDVVGELERLGIRGRRT